MLLRSQRQAKQQVSLAAASLAAVENYVSRRFISQRLRPNLRQPGRQTLRQQLVEFGLLLWRQAGFINSINSAGEHINHCCFAFANRKARRLARCASVSDTKIELRVVRPIVHIKCLALLVNQPTAGRPLQILHGLGSTGKAHDFSGTDRELVGTDSSGAQHRCRQADRATRHSPRRTGPTVLPSHRFDNFSTFEQP